MELIWIFAEKSAQKLKGTDGLSPSEDGCEDRLIETALKIVFQDPALPLSAIS